MLIVMGQNHNWQVKLLKIITWSQPRNQQISGILDFALNCPFNIACIGEGYYLVIEQHSWSWHGFSVLVQVHVNMFRCCDVTDAEP